MGNILILNVFIPVLMDLKLKWLREDRIAIFGLDFSYVFGKG